MRKILRNAKMSGNIFLRSGKNVYIRFPVLEQIDSGNAFLTLRNDVNIKIPAAGIIYVWQCFP